jgi:hypothetical protein
VSSGDGLLYPWASAHAIDPSWEFRTCDGAAAMRAPADDAGADPLLILK